MPDVKISALTAATTAPLATSIPVNEANVSKRLTVEQLADLIGVYKVRLTGDHTLSSTTGTEVMAITIPSIAGTWWYEMNILASTGTAADAPVLGVHYTGTVTATSCRHCLVAPSVSTTTSGSVAVDDVGTKSGAFTMAFPHTAFSTTAPNLYFATGHATISTNVLYYIFGVIVTTGTSGGSLKLYHGCEGTNASTVAAGSSITVWKA